MSTVEDAIHLLRDLGPHGLLTYRDTGRSRAYHLEVPGDPKAKRLVSVTTALQVLGKGEGFNRWQQDQGAAACLRAVQAGEIDPAVHHADEAAAVMRAAGFEPNAKRDAAAERGLSIHDALAQWGEAGDFPNPQDLDPEHRVYLKGLASMLIRFDPEPTAVEQLTCNPPLLYGGRFDLRAIIDGRDTLLDLKVRERPSIRETDCLQLVGYAAAEHSLGEPWPERLLAVSVGPDGSFVTHDVDLPRDAYERVLGVYRLLADARRPLDAMRRAAKKAEAVDA